VGKDLSYTSRKVFIKPEIIPIINALFRQIANSYALKIIPSGFQGFVF
jgi:hypothetical protein